MTAHLESKPAGTTAIGGSVEVGRLYDSLSRYQWWLRRVARFGLRPRYGGLEMHKRLRAAKVPGFPAAGCADLNEWLWDLAAIGPRSRVLDIGCGFGATLLAFARRHAVAHPNAGSPESGRFVGLTVSEFQMRKAQRVARRRGFGGACEFRRQSFDAVIDGEFDVVVSVETLLHAADVRATLEHLAGSMRPGGRILMVEDMAVDQHVKDDPLVRSLLSRWSSKALCSVTDYRAALRDAGFEIEKDIDLTDQLDWPDAADRDQRERRLRRLRRFSPFGRSVIDAFLGGLAMERLYAAGLLTYRTMVATRALSTGGGT